MQLKLFNRVEININRLTPQGASWSYPDKSSPKERPETKDLFFVHVHIPKTGGSTFNTVLNKCFGDTHEAFAGRIIHHLPYLTNNQVEGFIRKHPGMNCLSSHIVRATLPYQSSERSIKSIAIIRNPVDKFFSLYFHMRHRFGVRCIEKEFLIGDYIEECIKNHTYKFSGYLHHMCGYQGEGSFKYVKSLVDNRHLHLIDTYNMKSGLQFLKDTYPNYFTDVSFEQENISIKKQEVTQTMKDRVGEFISDYDWKMMKLVQTNQ